MGVFASKASHALAGQSLPLDVVASRPRLEPHEVASLRLTPHGVYATLAAHVYAAGAPETATPVTLPDGWEVLLQCAALHLNREGYFAVAYVHRDSRHCVIAQRGTAEVLGMRAGVWMYFEQPTIQFFLAEQFSKAVRSTLSMLDDGRGGEWFVTYTGHSLGAVIASCRAVEEGTLAITFESPGARAFIEKAVASPSDIQRCTVTYLRAPNPINTLKPHCGYVITIPTQQVALPSGTLFLAPSLPPAGEEEDKDSDAALRNATASLAAAAPRPLPAAVSYNSTESATGAVPVTTSTSTAPSQASSTAPSAAAGGAPSTASSAPVAADTSPSMENAAAAATASRTRDSSAKPAASGASKAAAAVTVAAASAPATVAAASAASSAPATAKSPFRWRLPSFRPQEYFRDYVFSSVGLGIPELQQYVSKVEPMIREMLEQTQQVHSIHSMRVHFQKDDEPGGEELVVRWPEHVLQFMEFYNTFRALEDPENQDSYVRHAYRSMLRRLYHTVPRRRDCIPTRYVDGTSLELVQLWWGMDASQRRMWPLSLLDHKALNMIRIKDGYVCTYVLTAMQAKQYLMRLVCRSDVKAALELWRKTNSTNGALPGQSKL